MGMSAFYGVADPSSNKQQYMDTFATAQELGMDFLDTAHGLLPALEQYIVLQAIWVDASAI